MGHQQFQGTYYNNVKSAVNPCFSDERKKTFSDGRVTRYGSLIFRRDDGVVSVIQCFHVNTAVDACR